MSAKVQIFTVFLRKHMFVLLILVFLKYFLFLNEKDVCGLQERNFLSNASLSTMLLCTTKDYWELRIFFTWPNKTFKFSRFTHIYYEAHYAIYCKCILIFFLMIDNLIHKRSD